MAAELAPSPSRERTLATAAIGTFTARVLSTLLGIATGIIIARSLGPIGKGIFGAPTLLLTLPLAMTGGMGQAMTFFMTKRRRGTRDLLLPLALFLLAGTLLLWIATIAYASFRGWNVVSIAFALVVPPSIVLSWQPGYYIATGALGRFNVQTVGYSGAALCAIAVALFGLHLGTPGALAAWVLATYAVAAVVVADAVRRAGGFDRTALRERIRMLGTFGAQCGLNDVLVVLNYRVDSFVIIFLLGLAPFGIYSVAVGIGEALFMLTRPLATAISREIGGAGLERATALTARTVRLALLLTTATGALAFTFGPMLLTALYGERFRPAADALRWLIPGIVAFASAEQFIPLFFYQLGRPAIATSVNGATIVLQALFSFALVPRFGIAGAAMASTASYVIGAAGFTAYFCRVTGCPAADVWIVRASDVSGLWRLAMRTLRSGYEGRRDRDAGAARL